MSSRRDFLKKSAFASAFVLGGLSNIRAEKEKQKESEKPVVGGKKPIVISTWAFGVAANEAAWKVLNSGGRALDAVEQGVMVPEADPKVTSVGYGGLPDRDGHVTLDANIIDENGNCGAVACLEHIMHPISVARKVMEKTPHVLIVGDGALQFALDNGFSKMDLLTPEAKEAWEKWKKENNYAPKTIDKGNHDTIGMVAIDKSNNISGACTTSGLAWKIHGRVGDSPIMGAGVFVDNEVGGACSTGKGEANIKICGSMLIVELMRNGKTPQQACEEAIHRVVKKQSDYKDFQLAFLATNKNGEVGAYSLQKGFQYAVAVDGENKLYDSDYYCK
jgi:N4-(beta-N-acetylglucosaminyl)-L-asparaginase